MMQEKLVRRMITNKLRVMKMATMLLNKSLNYKYNNYFFR